MESGSTFANVVLDLEAKELKDRLFTYRIPVHLMGSVFTGAQVLVPFGQAGTVGARVVSLNHSAPSKINTKEILEIVDSQPLFDNAYIAFLQWIADYYCATLSDVVSAAVPSFLTAKITKKVRLKEKDKQAKDCLAKPGGDAASQAIVQILASTKTASLSTFTLRQRWRKATGGNLSQFYRAFTWLRQELIVETVPEKTSPQSPKRIKSVIWSGQPATKESHKKIIDVLARAGGQMSVKSLTQKAKTTSATIQKLASDGLVTVLEQLALRDPLAHLYNSSSKGNTLKLVLSCDQEQVFSVLSSQLRATISPCPTALAPAKRTFQSNRLLPSSATGQNRRDAKPGALAGLHPGDPVVPLVPLLPLDPESTGKAGDKAKGSPWLLHGVTGSGKTEIYLRLIELAIEQDRTALLLVPEIGLTPQLANRLTERFGEGVAVWHSALSQGERYDTWRRLKEGVIKVLLGTRSAVLVDIPKLGLIILDEEHDSSYKQSSPPPRYHAQVVALEKGKRQGALVLLGSATPDIAAYFEAQKNDRILRLPKRILNQSFPITKIVDMRQEFSGGNRSIFSNQLMTALDQCLSRKEQAILLINRRGYASHVFCRVCGYVPHCNNCSVALVFHQIHDQIHHQRANRSMRLPSSPINPPASRKVQQQSLPQPLGYLACHHCGYQCDAPKTCPECASPFIKQYGLGTQRVEEELQQHFSLAKILRLDSDTTTKKGAHEDILGQFASGNSDILIGTQMVSKGLDIERVTVVGVLAADAAFNMPDYRSIERGFQLLTQVSGRAGRGKHQGIVILQTYNSELPVLKWSQSQDYQSLYEAELSARRQYHYPPFSQLIRVVTAADDAELAEKACEHLAEMLGTHLEEILPVSSVKILGPSPCLFERLRGKYRMHLLIKNQAGTQGHRLITSYLKGVRLPDRVTIGIDVDALDLF
jgi:primosomal protein N'